jgi:WD40 repeat protein
MNKTLISLSFWIILLASCQSPGVRIDDKKSEEQNRVQESQKLVEESNDQLISIKLYGVFFESHTNEDTLFYPAGNITLSDSKGNIRDIKFDAHGNYLVEMSFENRYEIRFESPDHYTKFLIIDSRGIPDSLIGSGYLMPTDMSLAKNENKSVNDLLNQNPIGKAFMNATIGDFDWDLEYTDSLKAVIKELESESELP